MDKRIRVGIDHCSIFNRDLATSTDIMFALGFRGDGNCGELSQEIKTAFVPSCRFVANNAYIECVQFPKEMDEFYDFLRSNAAVHLMTLLTPNAEEFRAALEQAGYPDAMVDTTIRENARHGALTGTAKFLLVPVLDARVPDTHLAYEECCTPELLYQKTRWQHLNAVRTIDEVTVCCDDEEKAEAMLTCLTELDALACSSQCDGGLRSFRVMDTATFEKNYRVKPDLSRSMYSAFTFGADGLDAIRSLLKNSSFDWWEDGEKICVNVMEQVNLVLIFQDLQKDAGTKTLRDKVAVITGASSGIGLATARLFAREGAKLVLVARNPEKLEVAAEELRIAGTEVLTIPADVSVSEECDKACEAAVARFGRIDVLVNNAGIVDNHRPACRCDDRWWDHVCRVNQYSVFYMTRAALRDMEKHGGNIVNISSIGGLFGSSGASYSASKAAVLGFTKNIAIQYAGRGIRCNAVCPGPTPTPINTPEKMACFDQEFVKICDGHIDLSIPFVTAEDQARTILFFASELSHGITGQYLAVDNGATL